MYAKPTIVVKDAVMLACFAYVTVQAARGWHALGCEVKEAIKDRRDRKSENV